jgi:hypothetical protein
MDKHVCGSWCLLVSIFRSHSTEYREDIWRGVETGWCCPLHVLRSASGTRGLDPKCVLPLLHSFTVLGTLDVLLQTHLATFHPKCCMLSCVDGWLRKRPLCRTAERYSICRPCACSALTVSSIDRSYKAAYTVAPGSPALPSYPPAQC